MYIEQFSLITEKEDFYSITARVQHVVEESGIRDGLCTVFCSHTTAGITINENADPDVVTDMLLGLRQAYPDRPEFSHAEGNAAAHLKAAAVGSSVSVILSGGELLLGTWQGIYFCEFDGPRTRRCIIQIITASCSRCGTITYGEH
ncbi:MAG: secondary thiamine-phosphate synthase enzyme YjbQ [Spirochaetaceae bacterium]|nr:secondary thiamine-phosphate synthase enzyme YjbQ [Spirochaetaceae bacterium]